MAAYALTSIGEILVKLQERTQAPKGAFWSEAEYLYAINEALRFWQSLTGSLTAAIAISTANLDGAWLDVPRQLVSVSRVTVGGVPLAQENLATIDYSRGNWESSPRGTMKLWVMDGATRIGVYPRPLVEVTMLLEGPAEANNLNAGDFVNLGNEELTDILDYCLHYLSFKEGASESEATTSGIKRMVEAAAQRNTQLRKMDMYRKFAGQSGDAIDDTYNTAVGPKTLGVRS